MNINWFGFKLGKLIQIHRRFNHVGCASQGLSIVQVGRRHAIYIGTNDGVAYACVAFVWLTAANPHGLTS